jgi:hypothetical protein
VLTLSGRTVSGTALMAAGIVPIAPASPIPLCPADWSAAPVSGEKSFGLDAPDRLSDSELHASSMEGSDIYAPPCCEHVQNFVHCGQELS